MNYFSQLHLINISVSFSASNWIHFSSVTLALFCCLHYLGTHMFVPPSIIVMPETDLLTVFTIVVVNILQRRHPTQTIIYTLSNRKKKVYNVNQRIVNKLRGLKRIPISCRIKILFERFNVFINVECI